MSTTVVLDVNETLLDMAALDPLFVEAFGDGEARRAWFAMTLQTAFAMSLYGAYAPFGEIAGAALQMTAHKRGRSLEPAARDRIMGALATLPAHGDVLPGLERMRAAGLRLVVLAQAQHAVLEKQLTNAGVLTLVERVFSADAVRRFKPSPDAYAMVRDVYGASERLYMVAAHDWDVAGAMHAGYDAAFVSREGSALNPLEARPAIVEDDLLAVAEAIVAREAS